MIQWGQTGWSTNTWLVPKTSIFLRTKFYWNPIRNGLKINCLKEMFLWGALYVNKLFLLSLSLNYEVLTL